MKLNFSAGLAKAKAMKEEALARRSQHTIMVVDDEATNLRGFEGMLGDHYPIVSFESAKAALHFLDVGGEEAQVSVIVSDQMMPEMTGVEFFRALKKRGHTAPRIMMTGFAALDNVVAAINDGAVFKYVTKPVNEETMLNVLSEAVSFHEMKLENQMLLSLIKELLEKTAQLAKSGGQSAENDDLDDDSFASKLMRPRRSDLCVLFVDVRGFTKVMSEQPPEKVLDVLQKIFEPMHRIVYEAGGLVDKHLGDGLMAVFGLYGGNTRHAAYTAMQTMVSASSALLSELDAPFDQLKLSLGLAAGEVVLGMLGSQQRSELAVLGEPANFAARLQEFTKIAFTEPGTEVMGNFQRVMGLYDESVALGMMDAKLIELPDKIRIRDFEHIGRIGVMHG